MKKQIQKNSKINNPLEGQTKNPALDCNKVSESYRSYFFRNCKQATDPSQSQSSQTNKLSKTKQRLKSTRVKSRNLNSIYYELESTKDQKDQALRQQNTQLKQTIAQLKIAQLYQIDQKKLLNLLKEIDELKQELKVMRKQTEKLKLENDFLNRSNFQLKLEVNRLRKKDNTNQKFQSASKQFKNIRLQNQNYGFTNLPSSTHIPEHLLLFNKNLKSSTRGIADKTPSIDNEKQEIEAYFTKYKESLSRIHSERNLQDRQAFSQSRKSQRTAVFTQTQNNQFPFEW